MDGRNPRAFTPREVQITRLICEGLKSVEIAEKLSISIKTVITHRSNIMNKGGFRNAVELARYAVGKKMVSWK